MRSLLFVGSHLGYPMDRTPLGGGAMVGLQLVRHWRPDSEWELSVLGSGPEPPASGIDYHRLAAREEGLVDLGEIDYARFCRSFEAETTDWILRRRDRYRPADTAVVVNDISEGPDLGRLAEAGYRILSIWHVDVVDYFNKLYLRRIVAPERLTRLHERLSAAGAQALLPDILDLIFGKQRETVRRCARMIVPSQAMAETVLRCYSDLVGEEELRRRLLVVPWGAWAEEPAQADLNRAEELREFYRIGPETAVLMTLSRVSPEKGLHLLLEGLALLESSGGLADRDVRLFVCGEPAFMQGRAYMRKVRQAAERLRRVRVVFPGYLDAPAKRAYLQLADLFVSPSIHESYGLNVVEAMHAGLPVLASDHYGARDVLPPDAGRLVRYGSLRRAPAALAAALAELLADPARLEAMGRTGRELARAMPFQAAADAVRLAALGLLR